jgi:antitoxin component YwqK of YwqJK toxin-antitoxin module
MERKKDFGPIGMKRERLLKLKHINWDEEGYVIKIETYKDGKLVK